MEMATKEVVAGLHEARMDLHANDHSEQQAARKIGFLTRDHYIVEAKDTRAQCKDFGSTHRFEALKHFTTHLAFSKRCITNQNLVKKEASQSLLISEKNSKCLAHVTTLLCCICFMP